MELVEIEASRIIFLTQVHRPAGQLYLPEAVAKLVARYSFAKFPSLDNILKTDEANVFSIGKFKDVQIYELKTYSDGVIVSAQCDSDVLDEFLSDFYNWTEKELGLVPKITAKPEKHYESQLIVKSEKDLAAAIAPRHDLAGEFNKVWKRGKYPECEYVLSGATIDCDVSKFKGRRKPSRYMLDRRIGVPFEENVFYSAAPLTTKDHLAFLGAIERFA